jgi:sulfide:quinone oxidoreductase
MRVLVLGAGLGGLELTTQTFGGIREDVEIVLIEQNDAFVFGFSKLDMIFSRAQPEGVCHLYRDIVKPGVTFVQAVVESIDPVAKHVETTAGPFESDILVVCLSADLDPSATPGLLEDGHESYTVDGAFKTRAVLEAFEGGRVVIGVLSTPYKCPPAPSETALLLHENLVARGLREKSEISLVIDFPRPIPPAPDLSDAILEACASKGAALRPLSRRPRPPCARGGGEIVDDCQRLFAEGQGGGRRRPHHRQGPRNDKRHSVRWP